MDPLVADANDLPWFLRWFYFLGRWIVDDVGGLLRAVLAPDRVLHAAVFLLLIAIAYGVGRVLSRGLRKSLLRPPRVDDAVGRLMGHLTVLLFVVLGFAAGLSLFGTSLAAFATGLGLLTLALGFGMQNTVANLMGGISLAVDKPFRAGDRIEVGKYWGTVQAIGLRSTRILTPRKETVIVPNKIMEEREIWNYTLTSPEYRLDVDVLIGYDADWRTAERILQDVAREHPNMLHYRPVQVLFRGFEESGVQLQLRAWLADVTQRAETTSDLLKAIKDRFDEAGIELPYPYRTLVYKKDLAPPAARTEPIRPYRRYTPEMPRVLLLILDPALPDQRAAFATSVAKALSAGIIAVHVSETGSRSFEAEHALRTIRESARNQRVWFKPIERAGALVETVRELVEEEHADLLLVGDVRSRLAPWRRSRDLHAELRAALPCPIVPVPTDFRLTPEYVEELGERIKAYRAGQAGTPASKAPEGVADGPSSDEGTRNH